MEGNLRTSVLTAIAPIAWGSTYFVTQRFLPPDRPLFGAVLRALPVGLVLLAVTRQRPRGSWWWKVPVLGTLNIGAFFALIYVAAVHLPGGLASTLTATSPIAMLLMAWPLVGEKPRLASLAGAAAGLLGVCLLVLKSGFVVDRVGVAASVAAVTMASLGFVLVKRWRPPVDLLAFTSWQLVAGGLLLLPLALLVEGVPSSLTPRNVGGFVYLGVVSTGLAYALWFRGLQRLEAGAVALIGLLNPVVGTLLGVFAAHETFGPAQLMGMLLVFSGITAGQPAVGRWLQRVRAPRAEGALVNT